MMQPATLTLSSAVTSYVSREAQRQKILDADGEAARDPSGLLPKILPLCGGEQVPVLAGYKLGADRYTGFADTVYPLIARASDGVFLLTSRTGVDSMHMGRKTPYAPSIDSALRRLVARDRMARTGYAFRLHAKVAPELATVFSCKLSKEWTGYYHSEQLLLDQVGNRLDIDCASIEVAQRLIEHAAAQSLPLTIREDGALNYRQAPPPSHSYVATINPRHSSGRPRPVDGWDGPARLELALRGNAIVQTRYAFGAPVDERVRFPGCTAWSGDCDRKLGSARVQDYLLQRRASRLGQLAQITGLREVLMARAMERFAAVIDFEARLGGLVGAGMFGGVDALLFTPRMLLCAQPRAFAGELPIELRAARTCCKLGDTNIEGFFCGQLDPSSSLYIDRRGWLYTVDDCGDEHPWACGAAKLLEKLALQWMLMARCETAVVVDVNIAATLASRLGLPRLDEASDDISEIFMDAKATAPLLAVERASSPRQDAAPMRTLIWAETAEHLQTAAETVRQLAPKAAFLPGSSYVDGAQRLNYLRRAGFDRVG